MIHEFAVDPRIIASWAEPENYRYFIEQFGVGTGRVLPKLPGGWRKLVWEHVPEGDEQLGKRVEAIVALLAEKMVKRPNHAWSQTSSWIENVETEAARQQFHAVISDEDTTRLTNRLRSTELDPGNDLWISQRSCDFRRNADGLVACLAPLLRAAREIRIVDAHFRPMAERYQRPLGALLKVLNEESVEPESLTVQIYVLDDDAAPDWLSFERQCKRGVEKLLPEGMQIKVVRLTENGRERFHNRYLLTDIGGVFFGDGFDDADGRGPQTDTAAVLSRASYARCWSQFSLETRDFEVKNTLVLSSL